MRDIPTATGSKRSVHAASSGFGVASREESQPSARMLLCSLPLCHGRMAEVAGTCELAAISVARRFEHRAQIAGHSLRSQPFPPIAEMRCTVQCARCL